MANKMSLCIIKYTYTQYVGVDIEKYTRGLFEYVKEAFGEFQPQMSEPGTISKDWSWKSTSPTVMVQNTRRHTNS